MGDTIPVSFTLLLLLVRLWTLWATRALSTSPRPAGLGFCRRVAAMGDDAEDDKAEADSPAGSILGEADWLAGERAIDVDEACPTITGLLPPLMPRRK